MDKDDGDSEGSLVPGDCWANSRLWRMSGAKEDPYSTEGHPKCREDRALPWFWFRERRGVETALWAGGRVLCRALRGQQRRKGRCMDVGAGGPALCSWWPQSPGRQVQLWHPHAAWACWPGSLNNLRVAHPCTPSESHGPPFVLVPPSPLPADLPSPAPPVLFQVRQTDLGLKLQHLKIKLFLSL